MAPDRSRQYGTSLLELNLVLVVIAILGATSILGFDCGSTELTAAHQEITGSLYEAFALARARGTNVTVALGQATGAGEHLAVQLGSKVKWGKPESIPLPPDMDAPIVAAKTGEAHPIISVTPRHTTLASLWFLNDGQEALCMRLSGQGHLYVLRWRRDLKKWTRL